MKCVILAAGRGERMMPLTAKTPKPLLKVNGIPIIDYVLASLPEEINEIIVVVKYLGDKIIRHLGKRKGLMYVAGSDEGNVYSFLATRDYLKNERFLLIYGDEIPNPIDVERCLAKDLSILTFNSGVKDGVMVLNTDIFNYKPVNEQFSSLVEEFFRDHKVILVEAENFRGEINTPKDLERVNNG